MSKGDYTAEVTGWLAIEHELTDVKVIIPMIAGLQWGLAIAARHPKYAALAHENLDRDYRVRLAGGSLTFEMMVAGDGDERTSPEKLADGLVDSCLLRT